MKEENRDVSQDPDQMSLYVALGKDLYVHLMAETEIKGVCVCAMMIEAQLRFHTALHWKQIVLLFSP